MSREGPEETSIPLDDCRHELDDEQRGARTEPPQRGGERVAHAEPSDQDAGRLPTGEPCGRQLSERLLRSVDAAAHQLARSDPDHELPAALEEA